MMYKRVLPLILFLGLGGASFWYFQADVPSVNAPLEQAPSAPKPMQANDGVKPLAEHHCAKLNDQTQVSACVERVVKDVLAGNLKPEKAEFDPTSCNAITDPMEQHRCFGKVGLAFAVSTGDIQRCQVIPLPDVQASCRLAVVVNEVKALYSLQMDAAKGSAQP